MLNLARPCQNRFLGNALVDFQINFKNLPIDLHSFLLNIFLLKKYIKLKHISLKAGKVFKIGVKAEENPAKSSRCKFHFVFLNFDFEAGIVCSGYCLHDFLWIFCFILLVFPNFPQVNTGIKSLKKALLFLHQRSLMQTVPAPKSKFKKSGSWSENSLRGFLVNLIILLPNIFFVNGFKHL